MAWQTVPGLKGKVYIPEFGSQGKKKACPDCFTCQNCSAERCCVCRLDAVEPQPANTHDTCAASKEATE